MDNPCIRVSLYDNLLLRSSSFARERGVLSIMDDKQVAVCGLYCGSCRRNIVLDDCHGCGCTCGKCTAESHRQACHIYQCAKGRGAMTCADCTEFPCIHLTHFAFDPIWRTHLPVLENLRRIQKIGLEAWMDEQREYWKDRKRLSRWLELHAECTKKNEEWKTRYP